MEWNERNCHFDECDFVKEAKRLNQYAFCSDYYRLKALYEYGGIYLDTDIEVKKDIPSYLYEKKCVFGFMYDNLVSTAFIMAEKGSPVIAGLLEFYERNEVSRTSANNDLYTRYLITKYPDLLLIGTAQQLEEGVVIYPKEWFECPTFKKNGGGYCVHHFFGTWRKIGFPRVIFRNLFKFLEFHVPLINLIYQNVSRPRRVSKNAFYQRYIEDMRKSRSRH